MSPRDRRNAIGRILGRTAEELCPDDLQVMADAPIMDPNRIFLPAGKLSLAETEARERSGVERLA